MTNPSPAVPVVRLSAYYFFYFMAMGALLPYWSPYLQSVGFNAVQLGQLGAMLSATKILAPYIWGSIGDHTGQRIKIIRLASLLSIICFAGVFLQPLFTSPAFWWMLAITFFYSFFWNANLPQFEVVTLEYLDKRSERYTRIRLWGSVGFIISVVLMGYLHERFGVANLPYLVIGIYLAIFFNSLVIRQRVIKKDVQPLSIVPVLRRPEVMALLTLCFLVQLSHGPYYTFFSIYMAELGYSNAVIGWLWTPGILVEILVFLVMPRWLQWMGAKNILILTMLCMVLRWLLIAYASDNLMVVIFAQTLHAMTFGAYHAIMVLMIFRYFPGRLQGRGQALYSSLSFGLGSAVGAFASGYLWSWFDPQVTFVAAAGVAVIGLFWVVRMQLPELYPRPVRMAKTEA